MGLLFRDSQTGDIAYFVNFYTALLLTIAAYAVLGIAVMLGGDELKAYYPAAWFSHEGGQFLAGMDVVEHGLGAVLTFAFRSGIAMCAIITAVHFGERLFRKKKRRPTEAAPAAASASADHGSFHHPDAD